jgi:hypothetical protein
MGDFGIDQDLLNSINVEQCRNQNKQRLDEIGGVIALASRIGVDVERGLSDSQVQKQREMFGTNAMPESPQTGFFSLLLDALSETILLILIAAAAVSLAIGLYEDPKNGYVEGAAIFIAVFLVSNIQAFNDYSKELKFRELEASSANDQRASVLRNGVVELINPADLVVGDIICLQVPFFAVVCPPIAEQSNTYVERNTHFHTTFLTDFWHCFFLYCRPETWFRQIVLLSTITSCVQMSQLSPASRMTSARVLTKTASFYHLLL